MHLVLLDIEDIESRGILPISCGFVFAYNNDNNNNNNNNNNNYNNMVAL